MYRVMLRMRVRPGGTGVFEEVIAEVAAAVAARPGNLGQRVFRADAGGADGPATYYVFSDWVDEEAFREHERSAEHRERIARLGAVREESAMTTMTPVAQWGAPAL
ncbi:heme-degrading monooxygenase HmoA [Saccharothrix coeruleofusca]|uniref:antibiotic biosynthesis monooxygenase family protein n=1 Tax=Saccharothrix coeruleofusca TaxID=33919 RepID=UPI001AEA5534|nr:antibiotic biosynthesis monooxygenase family protein [Saccharothrix coeruleofusca]MBP2337202.1 heme-degrading monooxygenase HmoA [Saccharothrix coeruleofusca]